MRFMSSGFMESDMTIANALCSFSSGAILSCRHPVYRVPIGCQIAERRTVLMEVDVGCLARALLAFARTRVSDHVHKPDASDPLYKAAYKRFQFHEVNGINLGVSESRWGAGHRRL